MAAIRPAACAPRAAWVGPEWRVVWELSTRKFFGGTAGLARFGGLAAVAGTVFLLVYFTVPAVAGWPYSGGSPAQLAAYASDHELLFFAGGWFQAVGSALCIVFVLAVLRIARTATSFPGLLGIVGSAALMGLVLGETVMLEAVPAAAANDDPTTVAVAFALSNGVFVRIFPLVPAPMLFVGIALAGREVLGPVLACGALVLAGAFVFAGALAVATSAGVFAGIGLSVLQALWFLVAGIRLVTRPPVQPARDKRSGMG